MFTKIKTKDGDILNIISQQYLIGTYYIINNKPELQGTTSKKEDIFHKDIRIKTIKDNGIIISGSILECKSKYPINVFTND